jgi:hypothetical protein
MPHLIHQMQMQPAHLRQALALFDQVDAQRVADAAVWLDVRLLRRACEQIARRMPAPRPPVISVCCLKQMVYGALSY